MSPLRNQNTLQSREILSIGEQAYSFYSLKRAEDTLGELSRLPCCVRILLENLLRHEDGLTVTVEDMRALSAFHALRKNPPPLTFRPARLVLEGSEGLSALTDLAAIRDSLSQNGHDPALLSPDWPLTVMSESSEKDERASFLKWSASAFSNLRLLPPGKGTSESLQALFLSSLINVQPGNDGEAPLLYPDSVFGTGPRLSLLGSLGVLAFRTDILTMESLLLESHAPLSFSGILGIKLTDKPSAACSASDIALAILRAVKQQNKSNGKIIEFYGSGLDYLSVSDRAVIADFLSETDALTVLFPIDDLTLRYLQKIGNDQDFLDRTELYARKQGLWRDEGTNDKKLDPFFTENFDFSLSGLKRSLGGPGKTYNPIPIHEAAKSFQITFPSPEKALAPLSPIRHGDIVLAAIGPHGGAHHPLELLSAGLVARKARRNNLRIKPWVRAFLIPPNTVLSAFLAQTGLKDDLEAIGFLFPETEEKTPPLQEGIRSTLQKNKITVCALSTCLGEDCAKTLPLGCAHYAASPGLIVAYALAGSLLADFKTNAFKPESGPSVSFQDLWPTASEIDAFLKEYPLLPFIEKERATLWQGDPLWEEMNPKPSPCYPWKDSSVFVRKPSCLNAFTLEPPAASDIKNIVALAVLGDNISTEHIVPHGLIDKTSSAGHYLIARGGIDMSLGAFESYTGNEEVLFKGAFLSLPATSSVNKGIPFWEVAERYRKEGAATLLFAGQNFGAGSSPEWAAKLLRLLGLKAVIAESFSPLFRLNLIRVGLLPLQIKTGLTLAKMGIKGDETLNLAGIADFSHPPAEVMMTVDHKDIIDRYMLRCRLDTEEEMALWRQGSLWAEALRNLILLAG